MGRAGTVAPAALSGQEIPFNLQLPSLAIQVLDHGLRPGGFFPIPFS